MSTAKTTAFVLSGGASLGAIQAGMLRALYERRISPDLIVGSSVGSVNGAFIASRPHMPATAIELASVWHTLSRGEGCWASSAAAITSYRREVCGA
jgi:NTE family protein